MTMHARPSLVEMVAACTTRESLQIKLLLSVAIDRSFLNLTASSIRVSHPICIRKEMTTQTAAMRYMHYLILPFEFI